MTAGAQPAALRARTGAGVGWHRGFTLIEMVIALAIFAIVASVVYSQIGSVSAQTVTMERRTIGTWIARNELTRLNLARRFEPAAPIVVGTEASTVQMAGEDWRVETTIESPETPDFHRVRVLVKLEDGSLDGQPAADLIAFLGRY